MENQYKWPKATAIYPDQGQKSYAAKRLRFRLRTLLHKNYIQPFEAFMNQHPMLIPFLNARSNYSYPLVHRFLDKRFSTKQCFQAICENLLFLPQQLTAVDFLAQEAVNFGEIIPDFEILLKANNHQPMEGFWALELRYKPKDQLVYLLTFGKLAESLLIAVIQCPNHERAKEQVKQLTKHCHGLRPAYLMGEVMKSLTQVLGYHSLLGIPQKYQNKSRLVQSKRYVGDYDAIFAESGGQLAQYWQIPFSHRSLDHIPSKKRSMYRKRFAMLDALQAQIQATLFPVRTTETD